MGILFETTSFGRKFLVSDPKGNVALLLTIGIIVSGCVSESNTDALTNTELEANHATQEEGYIAGKCNSANRLASSNQASEVLNAKLSDFSKNEANLSPAIKSKVLKELQAKGKTLTELDHVLKTECRTYSQCEFQASTDKQSCRTQKAKYTRADKKMLQFIKTLGKIKTG